MSLKAATTFSRFIRPTTVSRRCITDYARRDHSERMNPINTNKKDYDEKEKIVSGDPAQSGANPYGKTVKDKLPPGSSDVETGMGDIYKPGKSQ